MYVILTWDNRQDMDVVRAPNSTPKLFFDIAAAQEWIDSNDDKVCQYTKIVDVD
jgi:hypothetical protein